MKYMLYFCCLCLVAQWASAQSITMVEQGRATSIRGLSVVNDNIAWVSGSKGHVALSTNGGKTWAWQQLKGYEQSDFRDIEAFSDKEAVIMSSGTPALILKTADGGATWKEVYRNNDKAYFFDALALADTKHGYVLGDPIDGKFLLLETKNGGETWSTFANLPSALPGEAAFAASGTCLSTRFGSNEVIIVTGGSIARMLTLSSGKVYTQRLPVAQGTAARGAFSYANGGGKSVVTGGDYEQNTRTDSVACYLPVAKQRTEAIMAIRQPAGYQSCVAYLQGLTFVSTGTPGSNITVDGGINWQQFDTISFNVCQKAKKGNLVILAGDKGKIAVLKL